MRGEGGLVGCLFRGASRPASSSSFRQACLGGHVSSNRRRPLVLHSWCQHEPDAGLAAQGDKSIENTADAIQNVHCLISGQPPTKGAP